MRGRPPKVKSFGPGIDQVVDRPNDKPHEHEVESAMDTLARAEALKKDQQMMRHVHQASGKKIRSLKSLKALAGKKAIEEQGFED